MKKAKMPFSITEITFVISLLNYRVVDTMTV